MGQKVVLKKSTFYQLACVVKQFDPKYFFKQHLLTTIQFEEMAHLTAPYFIKDRTRHDQVGPTNTLNVFC